MVEKSVENIALDHFFECLKPSGTRMNVEDMIALRRIDNTELKDAMGAEAARLLDNGCFHLECDIRWDLAMDGNSRYYFSRNGMGGIVDYAVGYVIRYLRKIT